MMRPCLDCGTPTNNTRCPTHQQQHATLINQRQTAIRKQNGRRAYTDPAYRRASAAIRATATKCWICKQGPRPNDPFQADHIIPIAEGGEAGPLAPAHRSCNIARSNRTRNNHTNKHH